MLFLFVAYVGGLLTILSPCILPVLPFVFARADRPFVSHSLPLLGGLALAFVAVATLAAVGGGWAVSLNSYGRAAAMSLLALFGLTLVLPGLAERFSRPMVRLGERISEGRTLSTLGLSPVLLGTGIGLLWAPCAGPILGLILTGAALNGPSIGTTLLLAGYAAGACTSLAMALLFGGRLLSAMKRWLPVGEWVRRATGLAVLVGVAAIAFGLDTGVLVRLAPVATSTIEQELVQKLDRQRSLSMPAASEMIGPLSEGGSEGLMRTMIPAGASPSLSSLSPLPIEGTMAPLDGATEWINAKPQTAEQLRGRVVLVDFWTYSCINCLRTLPYVRAWAEKYGPAGLVVIGVHSPEFSFEKRSVNVHKAVGDLGITYPVAVDSNFAIWRAWGNQYWPAFYFVDAQGRIRHHNFGEGGYERAEQVIQQLLAEAGRPGVPTGSVTVQGTGTQAPAGAGAARSGETYLGTARAEGFAPPARIIPDRAHRYAGAPSLRVDQWTLAGVWTVEPERAVLDEGGGRIAYRFKARDLHLVLGRNPEGKPVRFKVWLDGKPPRSDRGADTDEQGFGVIEAQRLYQLVRQQNAAGERLFEIEFLDPGAQAYVFTFG